MTGTAKVKTPKNDQEWARNMQKRVDAVENPSSIRIGEWTLSTSPDTGNLIGSHVDGGSVVIAVRPAASQNPDEIVSTLDPYIKVQRQATQTESRGTVHLVNWDTVASQTKEWGFSAPGTDIGVPENGIYEIKYGLVFLNAGAVVHKGMVLLNGTAVIAQEFFPTDAWYVNMYMGDTFNLNAGDIITCGAYISGSGTFDFGHSAPDPQVYTYLSVRLLSKDAA